MLSKAVAARLALPIDAPIADRLRALAGLTVAVPSATSSLLGPLRRAAVAAGAQARYTYMAQPAMVAALESGAIDAMMASSPFSGAALLKGAGVLWINGPGGELPAEFAPASSSCLQTTAAYAAAHGEVIGRFRAALDEVAALIREHRADAKQALAQGYPQLDEAALDLAFAQQSDNWTHPVLSADDIRQEIAILHATTPIAGLDDIAPEALLLKGP